MVSTGGVEFRELLVPLLAVAREQFGCFTVQQWSASGLTVHQLKTAISRGWVERVWGGVLRCVGVPDSWRGRAKAATLAHPQVVFAARRTALRLHGVSAWHDPRPHVVIPHDLRFVFDRRLLVVHTSRTLDLDEPVVSPDGIPTTSVARALLDDGMEAPTARWFDNVSEAVRLGLVTSADLTTALEAAGRIPNKRRMVAALERLDPLLARARSVPEVPLARMFEEVTGERVLVNRVVHDPYGRRLGEGDVVVPRLLLAGELDSRLWHVQPSRMEHDQRRDLRFHRAHWMLRRVSATALRDQPELVRGVIRVATDQARARLHTVPPVHRRAAEAMLHDHGPSR